MQAAERSGDPAAVCEALVAVARAALIDLGTAATALTRAAAVATRHGLTQRRVEALRVLGMVRAQTSAAAPAFAEARWRP